MMPDLGTISRFYEKINFEGPTAEHMDSPCWLWTAVTVSNERGRRNGQFKFEGRMVTAHRFAYELIVGPIPAGLVLDHHCATPLCVNPSHLEPVTNKVNGERRTQGATVNSKSGVRGVFWKKASGKYRVEVRHNGVNHHGGYFTYKADAEQAAIALRDKLFGSDDKRREFIVAGAELVSA